MIMRRGMLVRGSGLVTMSSALVTARSATSESPTCPSALPQPLSFPRSPSTPPTSTHDHADPRFPALRRLMDLKAAHVAANAHPPLIAPVAAPVSSAILPALSPHRFDVILLHDPRSWGGTWADVAALPLRHLSADPSFVYLWVGAGDADGLERGRECLAKWGFRRAEDIVWVKTNRGKLRGLAKDDKEAMNVEEGEQGGKEGQGRQDQDGDADADANAEGNSSNPGGASSGLFASQKEHCLMGIRGTVRRSTDVHFVHCNVDTDVIVWEGESVVDALKVILSTMECS